MSDSSTPTERSAPPDPDLSGRRIGDYQLLRRLGRGGMADVYLAEQVSLARKVALKVLRHSLSTDATYVHRFAKEARAAANLIHPGIVQIYEVGCIDGVHFIAQEYVPGLNLGELLKRRGPLAASQAVSILRQVGAALHRAAEQGVVHRDIKPDNIMLSQQGEVKVADFGLARVADDVNLTQAGVTMGTPLYMSPEQVEGKQLDARSDLYSFGVTCYHLLAGRPPFEGDTALAVAVQHLHNEAARLDSFRPDLPDDLCRIVHRLMTRSIKSRYQSASEMLRELRALPIAEEESEWPNLLDGWNSSELQAVADARRQATQQLAAVMKTNPNRRSAMVAGGLALAAAIAAVVIGGLIAWSQRPDSLLAYDPNDLPKIERQSNAQDQYYYATLIGTEEALLSVSRFFPPEANATNQYYSRRATQRLAELYLQADQTTAALQSFQVLARLSATEEEFRAYGLAGEAVVYDRLGKAEQVNEKLRELIPLRRRLEGPMSDEVTRLITKYNGSSS
ncbi:serine/threonine-protein kinase [Lignipirellula cremea]|uniref:non-specific serine/threonine protein kinase n=1 Tax=Lignipirellula cremea TaxID=2528010 RepID=A0A518DUI4_9BACT|nr:serine/threonine-protein kinase [Lignipirellula cremea]QDU95490.1 Serine/threonine-protein kinase PrkC [Lignipirellula cremea]